MLFRSFQMNHFPFLMNSLPFQINFLCLSSKFLFSAVKQFFKITFGLKSCSILFSIFIFHLSVYQMSFIMMSTSYHTLLVNIYYIILLSIRNKFILLFFIFVFIFIFILSYLILFHFNLSIFPCSNLFLLL